MNAENDLKNKLNNLMGKYNDLYKDIGFILDNHMYVNKYLQMKQANYLDHCINSTADAMDSLEWFIEEVNGEK